VIFSVAALVHDMGRKGKEAKAAKGAKGGKGGKGTKTGTVKPALAVSETLQEVIDNATEEVKNIVAEFRKTHEKFEDPDFPADDTSIYKDPENPPEDGPAKPAQWRRLSDIAVAEALFHGGATTGDVIQGAVGTCYLLGAMSCVGVIPGLLEHLFVAYDVKAGVYAVRLFIDGDWIYTIIDDQVPCDEDGEILYAKCKNPNELWVSLLEKAYAKVRILA
jgi:hypothetical protein